jgi:hypothetical protein
MNGLVLVKIFLLKVLFLNSFSWFFSAWHNKEYIPGLFCDLTNGFVSVSHELFILKLDFYGVKCFILNWLKSYWHNRRQRVVLQFVSSPNLLSDWEVVRHGDPQGTVLGPLLFSMYSNDFPCIKKFLIPFFLQVILTFFFF